VAAEEKSGFSWAFVAGAALVLLAIGAVFFLTEKDRREAPLEQRLSVAEADKEYLQRIEIGEFEMMRANNMLGHELTYILGTVKNKGHRGIRDLEVTVEFKDMLGQVVLREIRRPFGRGAQPLGGGESRDFQLTFEGVPRDWNVQHPAFRVSGIVLD
jgi:hypothetical protein